MHIICLDLWFLFAKRSDAYIESSQRQNYPEGRKAMLLICNAWWRFCTHILAAKVADKYKMKVPRT